MLQTQRQRSGAENEEEVNRVKRAHEKLEARVASLSLSLREQLADKDVCVVTSVRPELKSFHVCYRLTSRGS